MGGGASVSVKSTEGHFAQTVLHEFGHSYGYLRDEYVYDKIQEDQSENDCDSTIQTTIDGRHGIWCLDYWEEPDEDDNDKCWLVTGQEEYSCDPEFVTYYTNTLIDENTGGVPS